MFSQLVGKLCIPDQLASQKPADLDLHSFQECMVFSKSCTFSHVSGVSYFTWFFTVCKNITFVLLAKRTFTRHSGLCIYLQVGVSIVAKNDYCDSIDIAGSAIAILLL